MILKKEKKRIYILNNNIKNLNLKENVDVLNKRHKKNIIFQTDIYICSTYKGNKNIKKKSRTIIFIIKVNV
nr:RecName: Full=PPF2L antigen [Plasmodium falciparum Palo Alto/Uganda]